MYSRVVTEAVLIQRNKLSVAVWKAFTYGFLFLVGIAFAFTDSTQWIYKYEYYVYPLDSYPWFLAIYYNLSLASYCFGTLELLFFTKDKLKDFHIMLVHHITTVALIFGSYYYIGCVHIGVMVMLVHDLADPFMEAAKTLLYAGYPTIADGVFAMFAAAFIIPRDWIYPLYVIGPLFYVEHTKWVPHYERYACSLVIIFLLDLYWSVLILKMVWAHWKTGTVQDDIREEHPQEDTSK